MMKNIVQVSIIAELKSFHVFVKLNQKKMLKNFMNQHVQLSVVLAVPAVLAVNVMINVGNVRIIIVNS